MRYDLSNPFQAQLARTRLDMLTAQKAVIDLTEKKQRTLHQNAYLHVCLGWLGLRLGHTLEYVKDNYYKRHCNEDLFVREEWDSVIKQNVEFIRSSRDLTKEEMTLSIERFRNFAALECGEYIPTPDEHAYIRIMENEVEQNRRYL